MERMKLSVQVRKEIGKEKVKKLRNTGSVPGVVYKKGTEAINIRVDKKDLFTALHTRAGENVLVDLEIKEDGGLAKKKTVIIKEVQYHPIKDELLHVDFKEILLTETIRVSVPIVAKGESEGVVKDGGTLEYVLREAEIECLPTEIPERIEVEVSRLKIGDSIYIKDLIVPSGIKILNDPELTVIAIEAPYAEKPAEEEVVAEEGVEPEVISREKTEDEKLDEEEVKAKEAAKAKAQEEAKKEKK